MHYIPLTTLLGSINIVCAIILGGQSSISFVSAAPLYSGSLAKRGIISGFFSTPIRAIQSAFRSITPTSFIGSSIQKSSILKPSAGGSGNLNTRPNTLPVVGKSRIENHILTPGSTNVNGPGTQRGGGSIGPTSHPAGENFLPLNNGVSGGGGQKSTISGVSSGKIPEAGNGLPSTSAVKSKEIQKPNALNPANEVKPVSAQQSTKSTQSKNEESNAKPGTGSTGVIRKGGSTPGAAKTDQTTVSLPNDGKQSNFQKIALGTGALALAAGIAGAIGAGISVSAGDESSGTTDTSAPAVIDSGSTANPLVANATERISNATQTSDIKQENLASKPLESLFPHIFQAQPDVLPTSIAPLSPTPIILPVLSEPTVPSQKKLPSSSINTSPQTEKSDVIPRVLASGSSNLISSNPSLASAPRPTPTAPSASEASVAQNLFQKASNTTSLPYIPPHVGNPAAPNGDAADLAALQNIGIVNENSKITLRGKSIDNCITTFDAASNTINVNC